MGDGWGEEGGRKGGRWECGCGCVLLFQQCEQPITVFLKVSCLLATWVLLQAGAEKRKEGMDGVGKQLVQNPNQKIESFNSIKNTRFTPKRKEKTHHPYHGNITFQTDLEERLSSFFCPPF